MLTRVLPSCRSARRHVCTNSIGGGQLHILTPNLTTASVPLAWLHMTLPNPTMSPEHGRG